MIETYCIYHINYTITFQKLLLDMDLMYPIVIKKTKNKNRTRSHDLPSDSALKSAWFNMTSIEVYKWKIERLEIDFYSENIYFSSKF